MITSSRRTVGSQAKSNRNNQTIEFESFGSNVIYVKRRLKHLSQLKFQQNARFVDLRSNCFIDFTGMQSSSSIEKLDVSDNPIESLRNFPSLPHLQEINVSRTPFSQHDFYRIAIILVCGQSLRKINGELISASERNLAKSYSRECESLIKAGWILTYPPPKPSEISTIRSILIKTQSAKQSSIANISRPVAVSAKPRKLQSKVLDETILKQQKEIEELQARIRKLELEKSK